MDLFQAFLIHALVGRLLAIALMMTFMVIVSVTVRNTVNQARWALKAGGDLRQYRRAPVLTRAVLVAARRSRRQGRRPEPFLGMEFQEVYAEEHAAYYHEGDFDPLYFGAPYFGENKREGVRALLPIYSDSTLKEARRDDLEWLEKLDYNDQYWCPVCAKKHNYYNGCIPNHGKGWKFFGDRQLGYNDLFGYDEYRWPGENDEANNEVTWEGRRRSKKGWLLNYGPVVGVSSRRYERARYVRGGRYERRMRARAE